MRRVLLVAALLGGAACPGKKAERPPAPVHAPVPPPPLPATVPVPPPPPPPPPVLPPGHLSTESLEITATASRLKLNGRTTSMAALAREFSKTAAVDPTTQVLVKVEGASRARVKQILALAAKHGLTRTGTMDLGAGLSSGTRGGSLGGAEPPRKRKRHR